LLVFNLFERKIKILFFLGFNNVLTFVLKIFSFVKKSLFSYLQEGAQCEQAAFVLVDQGVDEQPGRAGKHCAQTGVKLHVFFFFEVLQQFFFFHFLRVVLRRLVVFGKVFEKEASGNETDGEVLHCVLPLVGRRGSAQPNAAKVEAFWILET
jgi:hypothetical protein